MLISSGKAGARKRSRRHGETMDQRPISSLRQETLEQILEVARNLASTFDVTTILSEVTDAARFILLADRVSFFMYDHEEKELVLQAATRSPSVRIPADQGIVGECAQTRRIINVPEPYADSRFNQEIDRRSGYRTESLLTLPLVGFGNSLVGVMQLLNKRDGPFDKDDEKVAGWLAAQCAVALQRLRMTETMVSSRKLNDEINVAREIQLGTLPTDLPSLEGYDVAGHFKPTDQTGGDTYDIVSVSPDKTFVLLADATGHGIGPALSATQVRAMIRVALRLGADLSATFQNINDQLVEDLPEGRFVTAFLGLLDSKAHCLQFHSGGQGPILHFEAATGTCHWHEPSTFPMGFMPQSSMKDPREIELSPGDIVGLISDGVYEYENESGDMFGMQGVAEIIAQHHRRDMAELIERLIRAMTDFGSSAPQFDDVTIVLIRRKIEGENIMDRNADAPIQAGAQSKRAKASFDREFDSLPKIFEFVQTFVHAHGLSESLLRPVELVLEELFTNLVKYNVTTTRDIDIELSTHGTALVGRITDHDVEEYDITRSGDVDTNRPLSERKPGGLGLHLVSRMVDWIDYHHQDGRSTITFSKSPPE